MSYCINSHCTDPINPEGLTHCQACRTPMQLGKSNFRSVQPLSIISQDFTLHLKIKVSYEVEDRTQHRAVMEVFEEDGDVASELFRRIVDLLQSVQHVGLPKYIEHFSVITGSGKRLNCLVREQIPGQSLQEYLDHQGAIPPDQALQWLREICQILDALHRQGFKHLDIKPDNILLTPENRLVLIDFNDGNEAISAGYSPPEQADGQATVQSDFFALGRTMMHLLTGKQPLYISKDSRTRQLDWKADCSFSLPPHLETTIEYLVKPEPHKRPQSAQEILLNLDRVLLERNIAQLWLEQKRQRWKLLGLGGLVGVLLSFLLPRLYHPVQTQVQQAIAPQACQPNQNAQLSCGEKSLIPGNQNPEPAKAKGLAAYRAQRYEQAVESFEQARLNNSTDPEVLIFLNNAKIQSDNPYTLAIAAPLKSDPFLTNYILRGIAQLQDEVNQTPDKIHGRPLQILLANDDNDESVAQNLAQDLARMGNLIGILGHYASEISLATLPTYKQAQIPMVSFGSTSRELTCNNRLTCPQNVFFRVAPTTSDNARSLAAYANIENIHQKVAILYNPQSAFSRSLKTEFDLALKGVGGTVVYETSLCEQGGGFDLNQIQAKLQRSKVTAVALFPDGQTCQTSIGNTLGLINLLNSRYPILNDSLVYDSGLFRRVRPNAYQSVLTTSHWHYLRQADSQSEIQTEFVEKAHTLWGQNVLINNGVTGITAATYDAGKVMVEALKQGSATGPVSDQRQTILMQLRNNQFQVMGLTGQIQFLGSDRIDHDLVLLRALNPNCKVQQTNLVPLDYDEAQNPTLCPAIAPSR